MGAVLSKKRWAAARVAYEIFGCTHETIAIMLDCHVTTVGKRSMREGWIKPSPVGVIAERAVLAERANRRNAELARQEDGDTAQSVPEADERLVAQAREALDALGEGDHTRFLCGQWDALLRKAAATGRLPEKRDIDSLAALARFAKEFQPLAQERADDQKDGDAELGDRLRRIDDRIIELAEAHARWLVAKGDRGGVE